MAITKYDQFVKDVKSLGEYFLSLNLSNKRIAFISLLMPIKYKY